MSDIYGNQVKWDYNENNQEVVISDSLKRIIRITNENALTQVILPASEKEKSTGVNNRIWQYEKNASNGRIQKVVDPEGNETDIYYECCSLLPKTYQFAKASFDIDHFIEIHYSTGGIMRYELFSNMDNEENDEGVSTPAYKDFMSAGAFVTEFPSISNADEYFQKLIEIKKEKLSLDTTTS